MAEPAGLLLECPLGAKAVSGLFRRKVAWEGGTAHVGHLLCCLADRGEAGDVLIVHHDAAAGRLFLAWMLVHYNGDRLAPVWPVVQALADSLDPGTTGQGAVLTTFPEVLASVRLRQGVVDHQPPADLSPAEADRLSHQLGRFIPNGQFPEVARSMTLRGVQCKPFRSAWKTYVTWRDQQERPARISAATADAPFNLFDSIYTADGAVFERHRHTGRDIPFPGADPLSFRAEAGWYADATHVWQRQLAEGSPPPDVLRGRMRVNNPAALWEYVPVPGAEGGSFCWLFDRWDTMFWRDARQLWSLDAHRRLVPLGDADPDRFRAVGRSFGADDGGVYHFATRLDLDPQHLRTQEVFAWDERRVYQLATELPLTGKGFAILGQRRAGLRPDYRLTDGTRRLILTADGQVLPDDPDF